MAQQTPPAATPASHRTFWTSAAGIATALAGLAASVAPLLDPHLALKALAVSAACASVAGVLGNLGSILGEKQAGGALRNVVDAVLPHVADAAGPVVARAVDEAAPSRKEP